MSEHPQNIRDVKRYLRNLSADGLREFGTGHVAYVKLVGGDAPKDSKGKDAMKFVVFDADGRQLGMLPTADAARAIIRNKNMQEVTRH